MQVMDARNKENTVFSDLKKIEIYEKIKKKDYPEYLINFLNEIRTHYSLFVISISVDDR
jgi:homospermidine synthase